MLRIDDHTGEIWLRQNQNFDYENETKLRALAIPVDGSATVRLTLEIVDENDNSPQFPTDFVLVEFNILT